MPLAPGSNLGPYETVSPLRAGGTGEVYGHLARAKGGYNPETGQLASDEGLFNYQMADLSARAAAFWGRIPAGFCYQRLSIDDKGPPFSLQGLNAVYLPEIGWYRVDSRGNKTGVDAQFTPPIERLAFRLGFPEERSFPEILADPLPVVVATIRVPNSELES